jgi:NADH dehydrogenase
MTDLDVVTGAFSYTGRFVAPRLLDRGRRVRTLTNHPDPLSPLRERCEARPLDFGRPDQLCESLRGADTLYNTYWIRSTHGPAGFEAAVRNSAVLLDAARRAGVRRVVHVSIANPDDSELPYYRGKARVEEIVCSSGLSHAIVRPTLLFGRGDVLINNIAWFLRRLPVFGVPGDGRYRLQPVYVEDFAELIVNAGAGDEDVTIDAAGPDVFTFETLVRTLIEALGTRTRMLHVPPSLALAAARAASAVVGETVLTRAELDGLMAELLVSKQAPRCRTRFSEWLHYESRSLGRRYASEANRRQLGRLSTESRA